MENTIRQLLELYYEGDATPVQVQQLCDYFSTAKDIPADLAADKALFCAMRRMDDIEVPADLEARIQTAVFKRPAPGRWLKVAGIAAAVAVVVGFAISFLFAPAPSQRVDEQLIAEVSPIVADSSVSSPVIAQPAERTVNAAKQKAGVNKTNVNKSREEMAAEALLAGEASLRLLGEKIEEAGKRSAEEIARQIDAIDNSLNNIL